MLPSYTPGWEERFWLISASPCPSHCSRLGDRCSHLHADTRSVPAGVCGLPLTAFLSCFCQWVGPSWFPLQPNVSPFCCIFFSSSSARKPPRFRVWDILMTDPVITSWCTWDYESWLPPSPCHPASLPKKLNFHIVSPTMISFHMWFALELTKETTVIS